MTTTAPQNYPTHYSPPPNLPPQLSGLNIKYPEPAPQPIPPSPLKPQPPLPARPSPYAETAKNPQKKHGKAPFQPPRAPIPSRKRHRALDLDAGARAREKPGSVVSERQAKAPKKGKNDDTHTHTHTRETLTDQVPSDVPRQPHTPQFQFLKLEIGECRGASWRGECESGIRSRRCGTGLGQAVEGSAKRGKAARGAIFGP